MANLDEEFWAAYSAFGPAHRSRLAAYGVAPEAILATPGAGIGFARIRTEEGGLYAPDPDGSGAVIVNTGLVLGDTQVEREDLLAFTPADPGRWWLRLGHSDILGRWEIERRDFAIGDAVPPALAPEVNDTKEPLRVWRNPLSWLRGGCVGVVVLRPAGWSALRWLSVALVAEDVEHGAEVRRMLQEPVKHVPAVLVPATERQVAA